MPGQTIDKLMHEIENALAEISENTMPHHQTIHRNNIAMLKVVLKNIRKFNIPKEREIYAILRYLGQAME